MTVGVQFQKDLSEEGTYEGCVQYGDSDGRVFFSDYAPGVPLACGAGC